MSQALFTASRLTAARQLRGLTKKALAEGVRVSGAAMTEFENGSRSPSAETAQRLAEELDFPVEFLYGDDVHPIYPGLSSFRAVRSMTARSRDRCLASGAVASGIITPYLNGRFVLPAPDVPDLPVDICDPESAARETRTEWRLGHARIGNLIHLLESKGVRVFWLEEPSPTMDAVSFWQHGEPYILLNGQRSGERQRLSVAHELGHLILHRDIATNDREVESEAFAFAGSFLLPEDQLRASFRGVSSLSELFSNLFRLKSDWGLSVAATLRRSRDIGVVTDGMYERACKEISTQGWRKAEPRTLPCEESLLHEKVFGKLGEDDLGPADVARDLNIRPSDLLEFMPVGKQYNKEANHPARERTPLRLIA